MTMILNEVIRISKDIDISEFDDNFRKAWSNLVTGDKVFIKYEANNHGSGDFYCKMEMSQNGENVYKYSSNFDIPFMPNFDILNNVFGAMIESGQFTRDGKKLEVTNTKIYRDKSIKEFDYNSSNEYYNCSFVDFDFTGDLFNSPSIFNRCEFINCRINSKGINSENFKNYCSFIFFSYEGKNGCNSYKMYMDISNKKFNTGDGFDRTLSEWEKILSDDYHELYNIYKAKTFRKIKFGVFSDEWIE